MNPSVSIAIRYEEVSIRSYCRVGNHVKWSSSTANRTFIRLEACIRWNTIPQCHEQFPRSRKLANSVVGMISTPNNIVPVDEDAVRVSEDAFSPRVQELSFFIEDDHRVFAAVKDIHAVIAINGHARHFNEGPPFR